MEALSRGASQCVMIEKNKRLINHLAENIEKLSSSTELIHDDALKNPDSLFSTNWMLTLKYLNKIKNVDLIVDIGSTTTELDTIFGESDADTI